MRILKQYLILLIILVQTSCHLPGLDFCSSAADHVYKYPELPDNHNLTSEEIYQIQDIPKSIRDCMNTDILLKSCLSYPNFGLVHASSIGLQAGYGWVKSIFKGLQELEYREDADESLIKLYNTYSASQLDNITDPKERIKFLSEFEYIELILSQYAILDNLNTDQKIELIEKSQSEYIIKTERLGNNGSDHRITCGILSRLMVMDKFQPYLDFYQNSQLPIEQYFLTDDTLKFIFKSSEEYLKQLKK